MAGGSMGALPEGPVKIEHTGEGFPLGDLIKGGFGIFKSNFIASCATFAPVAAISVWAALVGLISIFTTALASLAGLISGVLGLAAMVVMPLLVWNYLVAIRKFQQTGESAGIPDLLKFDNLPRKYIGALCAGIGGIPFGLMSWAGHLYMERESTSYGAGLKAAWAFSKKQIVPVIICIIVIGLVGAIGSIVGSVVTSIVSTVLAKILPVIVVQILGIALGLIGTALTLICAPPALCAHYLAYTVKQAEIEAAAAEAGITL